MTLREQSAKTEFGRTPVMTETINKADNGLTGIATEGTWPGIASRFHLIIVAGLRTKQLLRGSKPRIENDKRRRRNTSIAIEEVKRGLVPFPEFDKATNRVGV